MLRETDVLFSEEEKEKKKKAKWGIISRSYAHIITRLLYAPSLRRKHTRAPECHLKPTRLGPTAKPCGHREPVPRANEGALMDLHPFDVLNRKTGPFV